MSDQEAVALSLTHLSEECQVPERNMAICNYCLNQNKYECEFECQPEGRYRYLEPEPLLDWEMPPELLPYRKMVDLPLADVLAMIWLHAYYEDRRNGGR